MRIFNLVITTKLKQLNDTVQTFNKGWEACKKVENDCTWATIRPVIHSLKELRNNTWDIDRVDHAINWLKDSFEVKNDS